MQFVFHILWFPFCLIISYSFLNIFHYRFPITIVCVCVCVYIYIYIYTHTESTKKYIHTSRKEKSDVWINLIEYSYRFFLSWSMYTFFVNCMYMYVCVWFTEYGYHWMIAQSAEGVEYTTASLQRGKTPHTHSNECPGYDSKQSDGEVPVMLELWGMWSTPSLASFPGPLQPKVVALNKGPIYGSNRTKPWIWKFTDFAF